MEQGLEQPEAGKASDGIRMRQDKADRPGEPCSEGSIASDSAEADQRQRERQRSRRGCTRRSVGDGAAGEGCECGH